MTDQLTALAAFLSQTGLPAYLTGQVPDGATFPYLVFRVTDAPFGQPTALEVTGWYRGESANRHAVAFLDRMASLVSESGTLLTLPHGKALLHRSAEFRTLVTDADAIGGHALLEARWYVAE